MQMPCRKNLSLRLQPLPTVLGVILAAMALVPADAFAQGTPPPKIDTGDTAWMLASTALVLVMTIPGVALLYGGMVRKKNVLATTMQVFAICCLVTVLWMIIGYSLAFTEGTAYLGGLSRIFLGGMGVALLGAAWLMDSSVTLGLVHLLGAGLGLATAVFYAGYMLAVKKVRADFSTATVMAWSAAAGAIALLPLALVSGESIIATTATGWGVLLALALLSHVGGQSLIAYALAHLPAAFSSVSLLLQPVAAAFLAWLILSEALGLLQGLGGAVVLAGIAIARRGSG